MGLWKNKYLVQRRDGTIPEWPWFVLSAKDPIATYALRAYADASEDYGLDPEYVKDIRKMADDWSEFLQEKGAGDPDAPPHRMDDPKITYMMPGE